MDGEIYSSIEGTDKNNESVKTLKKILYLNITIY